MKSSPYRQPSPIQPNTFNRGLPPDRPVYHPIGTLQTSTDELLVDQKNLYKQLKSNALHKMAQEDYKPAVYAKALEYKNQRSYRKKIDNEYKDIDLLANTDELRYFGLGPYFYVEFIRRLCWLLLVMSIVQGITIYINWKGTGLDNYSVSYFSYLIKATIGNYSGSVLTQNSDGYFVALAPAVNFLAIFLFYIIWKIHYFRTIAVQEEDNKDVRPQKFCIEMKGLPQEYVDQRDLQKFFTSFGPVYEVSVVRNYQNKLPFFQDLDELEEEIKEQELELQLGGDESNVKQIAKKKEEKANLEKELNTMHIQPSTVSAFVHFQFEKSKVECLSYFNQLYLLDSCCHGCLRSCCCCCLKKPDDKAIFQDHTLKAEPETPPTPSDINWSHFELGCCGKTLRIFFAALIIIAFLLLSTTIVGLCGIYISSHSSDCDGIDTSLYTAVSAQATSNSTIIRCYCNANLVASFTDNTIQAVCSDYLTDIYIQQTIQYVVLITEAITNILFGIVVDKLVNCVRPVSKASALFTKTTLMTLFLVINSIGVPVLIYADIFGFQPTSYVSLLTIISTDIKNFLKVESLSFYPTFTNIWYRNVSPLFTNYVIFNTLGIWGIFMFYKCCCTNTDKYQEDEGKILQKTMNKKMTDFQLDVAKETSYTYLIFFMAALFGAGIPILVPLAFINTISRYVTNRSLLQGNSSQVSGLGQDFSLLSLYIFPFMLIFFPVLGQWMIVSNKYIYPSGIPTDLSFLNFLEGHFAELDRQAFLPFYLMISVLALLELIVYNTVIRFCSCACRTCSSEKEVRYHPRPFSEYTKSINVLSSYNIRNNDDMRNVILHLEKYMVGKE